LLPLTETRRVFDDLASRVSVGDDEFSCSLATSRPLSNTDGVTEFRRTVRQLREAAPDVERAFAQLALRLLGTGQWCRIALGPTAQTSPRPLPHTPRRPRAVPVGTLNQAMPFQ
jgi:hypothetical protein